MQARRFQVHARVGIIAGTHPRTAATKRSRRRKEETHMTPTAKTNPRCANANRFAPRGHITSMRVAVCLLVATLATMCVIGGTLARYTTGAESSDSARVAVFGHSESIEVPQDWTSHLVPGATKVYDLTVTNNSNDKISEVAQCYNIALKTSGNLPLQFTLVSVEGDTIIGSFTESASATTCTFTSDSMSFGASVEGEHGYKLTATWPPEQNSLTLAGVPEFIQIDVNVEQVD